MIRSYSELMKLETFEERFEYLKLSGNVGTETFGSRRYVNQAFYRSKEWESIKNRVILRDNGCDLGIPGREIFGRVYVHHMNPVSVEDVEEFSKFLTDPEYLITTTFQTHQAIHYGGRDLLVLDPVERYPNDTCPWKA